ncbi:MAG TPA: hypothetical protein VF662_01430 [Allosphingosinicella sp.]
MRDLVVTPSFLFFSQGTRIVNLVEEIQAAALNRDVSASDLLRRVKLAAAKLKLSETLDWVDSELSGYTCADEDLPAYRIAAGSLMATTFHHGTRLAQGDPESISLLSLSLFREPIGGLEAMIGAGSGHVVMPIPTELAKAIRGHSNATYSVHFSKNVLVSIVDAVRNLVLDWAIKLESEGILGEGVSFSMEEKKRASDAGANVQITNYGHIHQGDVTGDQNRTTIGGNDRSLNEVSSSVFVQLQRAVASRIEGADRETLLELVRLMESQKNTFRFRETYNKFLSSAADHMGVLAPFLPALSAFLPS